MSRTKKGKKGPGYELWGKRRGSGLPPGRSSKKIYAGQERADARIELRAELPRPESDTRNAYPQSRCPCEECRFEE